MPDIFVASSKNPATKNQTLPQQPTLSQANATPLATSKNQPFTDTPSADFPVNHHVHLFASSCRNPLGMTFQNQDPNEMVLLFVRKDFVTNFLWIAISIVLFFLPALTLPVWKLLNIDFSFLPDRFFLFFALFYYLLVLTYVFINFITWYFNISLVTNVRIIELSFSGIVFKDVSATKIDLIQDVSYSQIGVLRTIFNYGDVMVQTAGTLDNFTFKAVPDPENIINIIQGLIGKEEGI